jgi:hypothetical protein
VDSRQRAEKQIRLVVALYRVEVGRQDRSDMDRFRDRAQSILANLEETLGDDPVVMALVREARRELWPKGPSAGGGLGEQAVDGGDQLGDGERLG